MKNNHREPTLYIVGNKGRADEIRHIIEDEWNGCNEYKFDYTDNNVAYFINIFGTIDLIRINGNKWFKESVENGWLKEYKLSEKPQFQPFDKVVVRSFNGIWVASYFSHIEKNLDGLFNCCGILYRYCLPYNEETQKLIGTRDNWEGRV